MAINPPPGQSCHVLQLQIIIVIIISTETHAVELVIDWLSKV